MKKRRRVRLLNMDIDALGFDEAVESLIDAARNGDGRARYAVTPNVDHLVRYHRDPSLALLYDEASLVLPDGAPLVWASRLLGDPLPERVAGSDLFPALCDRAAREGLGVFLLGGAPGAADGAANVMRARCKRLRVCGTYCPPFGFEHDEAENAQVVQMIRESAPDILFVGLGSPKQEKWIAAHRRDCAVPLCIGVGISFSFACGQVRRAPRWMQRIGLEWAHRLVNEPRRLWKRYLVADLRFLPLLAGEMLRRRARHPASTPSVDRLP